VYHDVVQYRNLLDIEIVQADKRLPTPLADWLGQFDDLFPPHTNLDINKGSCQPFGVYTDTCSRGNTPDCIPSVWPTARATAQTPYIVGLARALLID
jgi:hypothetical protein